MMIAYDEAESFQLPPEPKLSVFVQTGCNRTGFWFSGHICSCVPWRMNAWENKHCSTGIKMYSIDLEALMGNSSKEANIYEQIDSFYFV